MYLLCLETTCDETAAAVIDRQRQVRAAAVASQEQIHQHFQGVVPELAARAHLERLVPIVDQVLQQAAIEPERELAAVAVATQPGLPGSLLVGLAAAKALCVAWRVPLVAVNHIQAHIFACQLVHPTPIYPCVGLVISGGHTNFYDCQAAEQWQYMGGTIDDAVGEAFDKVAVMLGLPYPGGPHISRLAQAGNPHRFPLPRPMLSDRHTLNLSFSGLKTAVRYHLAGTGKVNFANLELEPQVRSDMAASFQLAAIDCVVGKAELAMRRSRAGRLCVGGGVAANTALRLRLQEMTARLGVELILAPPELCTDNAVMGAIAWEHVNRGTFSPLDIDITPGLVRHA